MHLVFLNSLLDCWTVWTAAELFEGYPLGARSSCLFTVAESAGTKLAVLFTAAVDLVRWDEVYLLLTVLFCLLELLQLLYLVCWDEICFWSCSLWVGALWFVSARLSVLDFTSPYLKITLESSAKPAEGLELYLLSVISLFEHFWVSLSAEPLINAEPTPLNKLIV